MGFGFECLGLEGYGFISTLQLLTVESMTHMGSPGLAV